MQLRIFHLLIATCLFYTTFGQTSYSFHPVYLPGQLASGDNQFSGLYIKNKKIWLLAESRLQEKQGALIYVISEKDLNAKIKDSSHVLNYKKYEIIGMENIAKKMLDNREHFEGLEALAIKGKNVYISIETTTPSLYAYLVKGRIKKDKIIINQKSLLPVYKPVTSTGENIYNAAFESMEIIKNRIILFFEYNYFKNENFVYSYNLKLQPSSKDSTVINSMPFRISDISRIGKKNLVGINTFYNGGGKDTVNRPSQTDTAANTLVKDSKNNYINYTRLVLVSNNSNKYTWKNLLALPKQWADGFNWEGISAYRKGYLLINDKYTSTKPYYSIILFIKPK